MKKLTTVINRFFQSMKSEAKRNATYALVGNLLYSVLGFAGIALLARSLNLADYGGWVIYLTASSLIEMMRLGFLHTALVRFSSGASEVEQKEYIASCWVIGLIFSFAIALTLFVVYLILLAFRVESSYTNFLEFYPILAIISLPLSISTSILQFKMQFGKMVLLRLITMILNLLVFTAAYVFHFGLDTVIVLHLSANLISSLISVFMKWSGIEFIMLYKIKKINQLVHFGKYSLGTLIGTNLLKSSDTFILGMVSGSNAAALYSVPLKLTETFEILLRAIVSVALPKLSKHSVNHQYSEVKRVFQDYSGLLTFAYIPVMVFCFVFSEQLLVLLGGEKYRSMADVFRFFCFYGLLLPIDRFTGVTLDCLNMPKYNFIKVVGMVMFNIGFDFIVLHYTNDLRYVALGTVLTTTLGIILGLKFLNKAFLTNISGILKSGYCFILRTKIVIQQHLT